MTESLDTYAAKSQFSRLLARAEAGEEIVITRRGKPVARLVPPEPARPKRIIGILKGQFTFPKDINDGDDEILRMFEESEIDPRF